MITVLIHVICHFSLENDAIFYIYRLKCLRERFFVFGFYRLYVREAYTLIPAFTPLVNHFFQLDAFERLGVLSSFRQKSNENRFYVGAVLLYVLLSQYPLTD